MTITPLHRPKPSRVVIQLPLPTAPIPTWEPGEHHDWLDHPDPDVEAVLRAAWLTATHAAPPRTALIVARPALPWLNGAQITAVLDDLVEMLRDADELETGGRYVLDPPLSAAGSAGVDLDEVADERARELRADARLRAELTVSVSRRRAEQAGS